MFFSFFVNSNLHFFHQLGICSSDLSREREKKIHFHNYISTTKNKASLGVRGRVTSCFELLFQYLKTTK